MIEVRRLGPVRNEAVFATADIRRGTRLAAEIPLVTIPPVSDKEEITEFCKAAGRLSQDKATEIIQLSSSPMGMEITKKDRHISREVWSFYRTRKWQDSEGNQLQGKKLRNAVKKTINLCTAYLAYNVQLGPEGRYGSGIFALYGRVRHSCVPNAHNSWNPTLERLTIHAIRDIKAGEQIFVNYTGSVCRTRQQRAFRLYTAWGIVCNCMACTEPEIDQLRHRMLILDQALAAYTCGASSTSNLDGIPRICTANEALESAEELEKLLKQQRLCGMELCRVYRECSKYAFFSGAPRKALKYAHKEVELEKLLIGTEVNYLKEELEGASYWLRYIQREVGSKFAGTR